MKAGKGGVCVWGGGGGGRREEVGEEGVGGGGWGVEDWKEDGMEMISGCHPRFSITSLPVICG